MARLQNGSVDSVRNLLENSQDAVTGLPLQFNMTKDARGVPVFSCSVEDAENKQVRGYSFDLANAQAVVTMTTQELPQKVAPAKPK